jgi:ubiquinone/menaquinone biosynthesis C-methylase UbiE
MTFAVPAEAYDRLMGRYSYALCEALTAAAGIGPEDRVLDVGAGTGMGTKRLVDLVGAERVVAVEPSETFVEALRERLPGSDVRQAAGERSRSRTTPSTPRWRTWSSTSWPTPRAASGRCAG